MNQSAPRPRSIARQFTLSYLLVSVLPLLLVLVLASGGFLLQSRRSGDLIQGATRDLNAQAEEYLRQLGEQYIQTLARNVATETAIYLAAHPDMTMADLQADEEFVQIVMQDVGETGYTCLYEAGSGVMRVHPNPALIDRPMSFLSEQLPSWWAIFEPSLSGEEISGYYDWLEPDGSIRQKYMTMTPVAVPFHGQTLMIAATTYIDEFSRPVLSMQARADEIQQRYRQLAIQQGLAITGLGAGVLLLTILGVVILGRRSAMQYIRPIETLAQAAAQMERGEELAAEQIEFLHRRDEVGTLAQAFVRASARIRELVGSLEQQVAERTSDLARRTGQLEVAAEVAREAAQIRDIGQLLDAAVRLVSDRFGFYHAGIFLLDEAGEYAVLRAASSPGGQRMLARGHRLLVGRVGIVGYVAAAGEPRIALDVGADAVFFDNPDLPQTRSEMALPLVARGRVIGVLDVQSTVGAAFTEEDVATLSVMADQLAIAIENARLFEQLDARLRELSALYRRYSEESWSRIGQMQGLLGYRYDGVSVMPVTDAPATGGTEAGPVVREEEGRSLLIVPVRIRDLTVAHLQARKPQEGEAWTPEEVAFVRTLAAELGAALESARLFGDAQRRAERERLIADVSSRLRESLDLQTVLRTAAREMRDALGLEEVAVRLGAVTYPGEDTRPGGELQPSGGRG